MDIECLAQRFSICKVEDFSAFRPRGGCWFIAGTDAERSLVCEEGDVPANALERSDGWRAFRVAGVLDFSLVGVLANLSALLAQSGVGIFAVSTYNTDYILTREGDYTRALEALARGGHRVR